MADISELRLVTNRRGVLNFRLEQPGHIAADDEIPYANLMVWIMNFDCYADLNGHILSN
ncbi:hypothetical protein T10_9174 [Trichinella papuae]|uniref:Uncharacterized protein n=1 Tax=Trichinella papuae TaxID=268474 RepID=A0A0V1M815_9BILA|nr:hypothetical protein T10_9174 [Trichinella papuae]